MRHNPIDRIGVYETASLVTKNLKWIFREQPIVDIGIDALIEEVKEGNPTGKFIALQIKTGEGNFHIVDGKITYYATQIHYNYWLNLNLPILMIAHFPADGSTYWQHINEQNFKRTKKQWKLEIPKNQPFNEKSIPNLTAILPSEKESNITVNIYNGNPTEEDAFEILEKVKSIHDATDAMINIGDINGKITRDTNSLNEKLNAYVSQKMSVKDVPVVAAFKAYAKQLSYSATRIEQETEIFADYYSEGVFAFESAIFLLRENKYDFKELDADFEPIYNIPTIIDNTLGELNSLQTTLKGLPTGYPGMKEARNLYLDVLSLLVRELVDAKRMTEKLIENLPKL
jgi:Domain of unknown function (DUF4365)